MHEMFRNWTKSFRLPIVIIVHFPESSFSEWSGVEWTVCERGPASATGCWLQFPFISMDPLGMSRLTRPVALAALFITSIHLSKVYSLSARKK